LTGRPAAQKLNQCYKAARQLKTTLGGLVHRKVIEMSEVEELRVILERVFLMPVAQSDAQIVLDRLDELQAKSRPTPVPLDSAGRCAFYQGVGDDDCWECKHAPGNQPPSK
jgi:hypothetical protein